MKLNQAIDGYFLDKELELSKASVKSYRFTLTKFSEYMGNIDVAKITSSDIKRYLIDIVNEGQSKRTAHQKHAVISSLFTWLLEEEVISTNIMSKVKQVRFNSKVIVPLTTAEIKTLLNAIPKSNYRLDALFKLGIDTGLRLGDCVGLNYKDIDFNTGKVFIRSGKGDKDRIVYAGKKALKAIWKYRTTVDESVEPLFVTSTGKRLQKSQVQRYFADLSKSTGIHVYFHLLRHTYAINFLRNGGSLQQLQILLGHQSANVTMLYVRIAESDLENSASFSPLDRLK